MKQLLLAILILAASQVNAQYGSDFNRFADQVLNAPDSVKEFKGYNKLKKDVLKELKRRKGVNNSELLFHFYFSDGGSATGQTYKKYQKSKIDKMSLTADGLTGINNKNVWRIFPDSRMKDIDKVAVTSKYPYKKHGIVTRTIYKKPEQ